MIKAKKNKNWIVKYIAASYVIMIVVTMLSRTDNFSFLFLLRFRYLYLFFMLLYFFSTFYGVLPKKPVTILSLLMLHSVLFGIVYTNPRVAYLTQQHFKEMVIYILTIGLTGYFVYHQRLFNDFMQWNYWATAFVLLRSGLTHTSDFVNPLYFVFVFDSSHTYRTTFGFGHANFTGNLCVFSLIYSLFVLEYLRDGKSFKQLIKKRYARIIILTDVIIGEILFSTQSRTSILAGIVFVFIFAFFHWDELFHLSKRNRAVVTCFAILFLVLLLVVSGNSIWEGAHREGNITVNYPIFNTFNPMTGMGYIPPYGFYTDAFKLGTFALDIYYIYIFFSTGYLGSAIILLFLVTTAIYILQIHKKEKKAITIALYIAILITGIGQTNMVLYTLLPSMINWTTICIQISPTLSEEV